MGKRIRKFGPRSLEKARKYVNEHPKRQLYILRGPDRCYWVCNKGIALDLEQQGMPTISSPGESGEIIGVALA
jgi:hypothetical protein